MKKVVLLILDGWGISKKQQGNAIDIANTYNFDLLWKDYPHSKLKSHGEYVGLPRGLAGSSEVGHENIGAGRIFEQELITINKAIADGSFFENEALIKAVKTTGVMHLVGLVSDGSIHSHIDHVYALIELAKKHRTKVMVHAILDGRDVGPKSAKSFLKKLEKKLKGVGEIATLSGRFYAMDRDFHWERIKKVYDMLMSGEGVYHKTPYSALKDAYKKNETDEFVSPVIVGDFHGISDKDSIVFFNYRPERIKQLAEAFIVEDFSGFKRKKFTKAKIVTMYKYDHEFKTDFAFGRPKLRGILGEVLEKNKVKQLRITETDRYPHVTYYFNNGREEPYDGEDRILVPRPDIERAEQKPELSADEVTEKLVRNLNLKKYGFVLVNLVNADIVGHSGMLDATVKAVEVVDNCLGKIVQGCKENGYVLIVTSEHAKAETMLDKEGAPYIRHTTNEVPFIIVGYDCELKDGKLGDIAPTVLRIMGIEKPEGMTGESLIKG